MGINYAKYRAALERQYTDRATISRYVPVTKPNKQTVLQLQQVYSDQPCRISQTRLPKNGQTEAQNDIRYDAKLFIAPLPDVELLQGDEIVVTGRGVSRNYVAGEPFPYPTHQEIGLTRKDKA